MDTELLQQAWRSDIISLSRYSKAWWLSSSVYWSSIIGEGEQCGNWFAGPSCTITIEMKLIWIPLLRTIECTTLYISPAVGLTKTINTWRQLEICKERLNAHCTTLYISPVVSLMNKINTWRPTGTELSQNGRQVVSKRFVPGWIVLLKCSRGDHGISIFIYLSELGSQD